MPQPACSSRSARCCGAADAPNTPARPPFTRNLARAARVGNARRMNQRCEVCESFRPQGDLDAARELLEVPFGERHVLLCRGHAGIAKNSGVSSLDQLRELYAESGGQRSYVARRARMALANGSGPRSPGRRASDMA